MDRASELFPPLDDLETLMCWLSEITGRDQADVQRRLLAECDFCGKCICEDAEAFGLMPNVWNERMIEFYRVTDAFLFSNASWNSTRMKRELTNTVCRIMTERLPLGSKILCYGDGMGFDSAALAKCGFRVTCYEISELSLEFARRLFSLNELEVVIEREDWAVPETLGLTLAEGKQITAAIQTEMVRAQASTMNERFKYCARCELALSSKGYRLSVVE